ncbi:hypothetical protein BDB00DRAFT_354259 [Zychaea mexicana]|uniref:uncharacterized protein n=1 Tax=Zychaea mexicana TaxID=64656 RepID=UPI0022FDB7D6|nr:uncharacterized protein BDB00DRAFT_354259 [Zychaea mexicana]KAI9493768.1 hypothetical protein BDB00DRAFT_354259 [Zychaea mexicana]
MRKKQRVPTFAITIPLQKRGVAAYISATITQSQGASTDAIPKDERERLCNETKAACADACHHASASCDTQTLVWGCHCPPNNNNKTTAEKKMIGTKPIGTFPIPRKMCRIDLALCQSSCQHMGEHGNQAKICRMQCAGSFPCDSSTHAPAYNGTTALTSSSSRRHAHDDRAKDPQQQQQQQQHVSSLGTAAAAATRTAQGLVIAIALGCCCCCMLLL